MLNKSEISVIAQYKAVNICKELRKHIYVGHNYGDQKNGWDLVILYNDNIW